MILRLNQNLLGWYLILLLALRASASYGDLLPEFKHCVENQVCKQEKCDTGEIQIPLHHRFLLWNCNSECDYRCQHVITNQRVTASEPIVQFHGKWPFYRFLGMQEPFSVLFSFFNFLAHHNGLSKIMTHIPESYSMRKYYVVFAYFGMMSWTFSVIFHTRDYKLTERLDYFAAGASVMYGFYYTPIRIFRMNLSGKREKSIWRIWTGLCLGMYAAHVGYLTLYKWDYAYNIAANVVIGISHNAMWSWYSFRKYQKSGKFWATWPGIVVAWVLLAMSFELMDFPPIWGYLDAHSLWHLGTVVPTVIWYKFLIKDAQDDLVVERLKA